MRKKTVLFQCLQQGQVKSNNYPCSECDIKFKSKVEFIHHKKVMHEQKTLHECHICGNFFSRPSGLRRHQVPMLQNIFFIPIEASTILVLVMNQEAFSSSIQGYRFEVLY
jgi:Zinc finger, C2H2 type